MHSTLDNDSPMKHKKSLVENVITIYLWPFNNWTVSNSAAVCTAVMRLRVQSLLFETP